MILPLPDFLSADPSQRDDEFGDSVVVHDARPFLAELLKCGDFGVGTFADSADGMVIVEGNCFRLGPDAGVGRPGALDPVRNAVVIKLGSVASAGIGAVANKHELISRIESVLGGRTGVAGVELTGTFSHVEVSTVASLGPDIPATAAFGHTEGTVAGFRIQTVDRSTVRYYMQFLNADRIFGGRLADVSIAGAQLRVRACAKVHRIVDLGP